MFSNFLLGTLKITEAATLALKRSPLDLIARHAVNEHGNVPALVLKQNQINMGRVGEIKSCYPVDPLDPSLGRVLVITDDEWQTTIVKLESEP